MSVNQNSSCCSEITGAIPKQYVLAGNAAMYALTLGSSEAWQSASCIWSVRLSPEERAALAFWALKSQPHDDACLTADCAVISRCSQPLPALLSYMDEAAFWAEFASPRELKAYALATLNRMSGSDQAAFLEYVQGRCPQ